MPRCRFGSRRSRELAPGIFTLYRLSVNETVYSDVLEKQESLYTKSNPVMVPVAEANRSVSMPMDWSMLTNRLGNG